MVSASGQIGDQAGDLGIPPRATERHQRPHHRPDTLVIVNVCISWTRLNRVYRDASRTEITRQAPRHRSDRAFRLTRMSRRPSSPTVCATAPFTAVGSALSALIASAFGPRDSTPLTTCVPPQGPDLPDRELGTRILAPRPFPIS